MKKDAFFTIFTAKSLTSIIFLAIFVFICPGLLWGDEDVWTRLGPRGGQIHDIVYDPQNENVVYAAMEWGGIYRSRDGGKSWQQVAPDQILGGWDLQIAIDPTNSNTLYAVGNSAYKSTDGGSSWQEINSGITTNAVRDIILDPANPNNLFIGTYKGIFRSTNAGSHWTAVNTGLSHLNIMCLAISPANPGIIYAGCEEKPIVFKSTDRGNTWNIIYSGSSGSRIRAIAVDAGNAHIVYTSEFNGEGTFKSTNGGTTWKKIFNNDANVIVLDPVSPGIIYLGRNEESLYKSVDSGSNWTSLKNGFSHGGGVGCIAVNPFNNNEILLGTGGGIFRSEDGGLLLKGANSGIYHLIILSLAIDPVNPKIIYAGSDGGNLFKSMDQGETWLPSKNGIQGHSITGIAVDPVSPNVVYCCNTCGLIYKSTDSGGNWVEIFSGISRQSGAPGSIVIDPANPNIIYTAMYEGQGHCGNNYSPAGIFKSIDNGASWTEFNTGLTNGDIRALVIDHGNTNTLYAGTYGDGIFKTFNGAAVWQACNNGLTDLDVRALVIDPNNSNIIYAGTNRDGIFKSTDSGENWTLISMGLPDTQISCLAIPGTNSGMVYAGSLNGRFYYSSNEGISWWTLNLEEYIRGINTIAISPLNSNHLYIGTACGSVLLISISEALFPQISINRSNFSFGAAASGEVTPPQYLLIENSGGGILNWSISDDANWLSCTPDSGGNWEQVTISIDAAGLAAGTYTGTITIIDANAVNSPQPVNVTLNVFRHGQSAAPFGFFATPIDNSIARSSIPVTGWALDDLGIESVKIYRGEVSNLVYIGDAVFVEGARPDVEQAYPGYPMNYKAGWGYMMLTNFLPGQGNGPFKIHAIATDLEGNQATLGTKTIICDNANAVKPFGAIDTPTQGGIASGNNFINWGWVLTPQPNSIPTDGSTINVYVDGVYLGHPVYNIYRQDIANLFPGCANSNGAAGYFSLDTTNYENGVHTIQWTATDSAGNTDGIGSRYFTIWNTGNSRAKAQPDSRQ